MRWIIRQLLFHMAALLVTTLVIPGFSIGSSFENIGIATVALSAINVFAKPIVKILFLPLNILTLNLFSVVINIGVVFALTKLVPTVKISSWQFNGYSANGFIIPRFEFTVFYTFIIVAIVITTVVTFLNWLTR